MSSPEKEKCLSALESLNAFCQKHNKKANLVEQIQIVQSCFALRKSR